MNSMENNNNCSNCGDEIVFSLEGIEKARKEIEGIRENLKKLQTPLYQSTLTKEGLAIIADFENYIKEAQEHIDGK